MRYRHVVILSLATMISTYAFADGEFQSSEEESPLESQFTLADSSSTQDNNQIESTSAGGGKQTTIIDSNGNLKVIEKGQSPNAAAEPSSVESMPNAGQGQATIQPAPTKPLETTPGMMQSGPSGNIPGNAMPPQPQMMQPGSTPQGGQMPPTNQHPNPSQGGPMVMPPQQGSSQIQPIMQPPQPGMQQAQPGMQPAQPGMQQAQPGMQPAQPGMQQMQPGMQQSQPGMQQTQPSMQPAQPSQETPIMMSPTAPSPQTQQGAPAPMQPSNPASPSSMVSPPSSMQQPYPQEPMYPTSDMPMNQTDELPNPSEYQQ
jgi:hypothetical protein